MRRFVLSVVVLAFVMAIASCGTQPPAKKTPPSPVYKTPPPPGGVIPRAQQRNNLDLRPANPWYEDAPHGVTMPEQPVQDVYGGGYSHEPANPFNIGLLVPLTGRYSALGQQMMEAAQLALFNFHDARVNLMPFDTKEDVDGAVDAFKLARGRDMDIILGPLFSDATGALAGMAKRANVPLVSFTNDIAMASKGAYVFGLLPQTQYETLVRFALSQNIRDFSLLAPNNVYGGAVLRTVRHIFKKRDDVNLTAVELYRADRRLPRERLSSHIDAAVNPLIRSNGGAYGALILPETGPRLTSLMNALRRTPGFLDKVQVMGDASWAKNPEVMGSPALSGAWLALPPQDKQANFERQFQAAYRHSPGTLAALAYDGVSMIVSLVRKYDAGRVTDEMLTDEQGFSGIHGVYRFDRDRAVRRNLAIYRADGTGNLSMLAPAVRTP